MEKRSRIWLWIFLAIVGLVGVAWVSHIAVTTFARKLVQGLGNVEIPVDESEGYYNKSEESPEFFGRRTGIILPEGTKPVYMIHSEGVFPPYRLEAHVIIPNSEVQLFLQANEFEETPDTFRNLSFLKLTNNLPPHVHPARPEGMLYVRSGDDSTTIPVWWTYVLNGATGDLWIQYNTE